MVCLFRKAAVLMSLAMVACFTTPSLATLNQWTMIWGENSASVVVATPRQEGSPNIIFAASWDAGVGGAIVRSEDDGSTWTAVLPLRALSLAVRPEVPGRVYAATIDGLFASSDFGDTWNLLNAGVKSWVAVGPTGSSWLFGDNMKSVDDGATFTPMAGLPVFAGSYSSFYDQPHLKLSRVSAVHLIAYVNGGAWESTDGGESWIPMPRTFRSDFFSVEMDPTNPANFYVGYCNSVQYVHGTATALGYTSRDETGIAVDSQFPNVVYVIGQERSFKSTNGGVTYAPYAPPLYPYSGANGRLIFDGATGRLYWPSAGGVQMCETRPPSGCADADADFYFADAECGTLPDCNDSDPAIFPGATEICDDGIDNNCDGLTDCADSACSTTDPGCLGCADLDVDGDGFYTNYLCNMQTVDCDDNDPAVYPGAVEICGDRVDNDCDWTTDCDDADCTFQPPCNCLKKEAGLCANGIDDDCDGRIDCDDPDCSRSDPACVAPPPEAEICDDTIDNDGDGRIDCDDRDCRKASNCK